MNRILIRVIAIAIYLTADLCAATPNLSEFTAGFSIETAVSAPIYQLKISRQVYLSSVRTNLSDIAVFDSAGVQVPHLVRAQLAPPPSASTTWISLPIFPVPVGVATTKENLTIRADGTVVRIERSARATSGHGHRTFIVDASQVRGVITELELAVTETNHEFVLALAVDTGATLGSL
ncbi:MAG: hypothetical protein ACI915_001396 [Gammaproteobacteria bacterium]|jgi:hypothetical protein